MNRRRPPRDLPEREVEAAVDSLRRDRGFDRRRERRIGCDITFGFQSKEKGSVLAHAVDLSSGGIRFWYVGHELDPGEALLVQFTLGRQTFSFCGHPLRRRTLETYAHEVALSFAGIDARARARLRRSL